MLRIMLALHECSPICCKIGPQFWKIDSTDYVKMSKNDDFHDNSANFQPKLMILAQEPYQFLSNFVELAHAQKPCRGHSIEYN